ncbi:MULTISPECIES: NAD+ synthase [Thauera]|jgi:NAD+ synthase (glutamine-hydrolysing)|uniref:Glutamine-dependent NAD(+) synthetase n=2 Tax=Thauera aminoaromatica TaxID=164330 RepID=C4ZKJ4_THASP|nr:MULTISPECIES: NAD+ synthase [Thauera]MBL8462775.1 NAD+ synthase [Thauera sp.]ACK54511.1 NAD+ synthetase [Thauera aminoaromatica]ENO86416.1 NAD synthetase [Thauera aminoaromatica S2]KIN89611.1 NAD+ synthetase [Thauera sp. SWB20]MCK6397686.1 NAD+ synthase [Thauera aminoaromatica]
MNAHAQAPVSIAVAQLNLTVGDLVGNADHIIAALDDARAAGAQLLLTPELALSGYPPEDLLLRPDFYRACAREVERIAAAARGVTVVLGHPVEDGGERYNAASVLRDGAVLTRYHKSLLPNYEVFDEERYFEAGGTACVFECAGVRFGVNICADVWERGPAEAARAAGAQVLLALNASPYHMNKQAQRLEVLRARVAETGLPVLYCNMVGGQDELVFDGASFALDAGGAVGLQLGSFVERVAIVDYASGGWSGGEHVPARTLEAEVYEALRIGVRDYLAKNRFPGAIIGLSGGIDSALTLAIAVDALGADKVRAVMMPSPYTAQMSLDDSRDMVARLGVRYDEIAIEPAMKVFAELLADQFAGLPADTTEENLQARIRGMLLMALSNKTGAIVLTTGNKSEMATGYATLYGDMAGGFAVLKDLYKTFVFRLSNWRNTVSPVIPQNIIDRPPSAELKPDQKDQDSLPPYDMLDAIIQAYMERDESPRDIVAAGFPEGEVRRVVGMLKRNEYKRRQAPVGIRVTQRGFGRDWRYPITSRYQDEF